MVGLVSSLYLILELEYKALVTGRSRTVGTLVLGAIAWHRRRVQAVPIDGRRVTGDMQAQRGRSVWRRLATRRSGGGGRAASGRDAGADVGHGQVDGRTGAGYGHDQAVRADRRVL